MEKLCDFLLGPGDPEVSRCLKGLDSQVPLLDRRFTQQEDFFLVLDRPVVVEAFGIHHDVHNLLPSERYLHVVRSAVKAWSEQVPGIFHGLSWFFDPKDLFHPLFVQVFTARDKRYLFLLRADLTFRGRHGEILERGGNDTTPRYSTRCLFLESEVLPLESLETLGGERRVSLTKLFPFTWQGEEGRGYFVTGRWLDQEITKLLSRAALAPGVKSFPCYPLRCRYETLSSRCLNPGFTGRQRAAAVLSAAWPLVSVWADRIQSELRDDPFREDHPLVAALREDWAGRLENAWGAFRTEAYLNESEQKEYRYYGD